jgi:hypothetical protein
MSHFYGTLQGNRGEATRCGHKTSGITVTGASWDGCVQTHLYYDKETNTDMVRVSLGRWRGNGTDRELYHGPVSGHVQEPMPHQVVEESE